MPNTLQYSYDLLQGMMPESMNIGGVKNRPFLGSANMVLQRILEPPFRWPWNRNSITFTLSTGVTDYTPNMTGTVTTIGTAVTWVSGSFFSPLWVSSTITINAVPYTVSSVTSPVALVLTSTAGTQSTAVAFSVTGVSDFGWIEAASVTQAAGNTMEIPYLRLMFNKTNETGRPDSIAPLYDTNAGSTIFRVSPAPSATFNGQTVTLVYQKTPPTISALSGTNGTWAPIPDRYSMVYQAGLQYYMLMYSQNPADRSMIPSARVDFLAGLLANSEGLSESERDAFQAQWIQRDTQRAFGAAKNQQGIQARGT